MCSLRYTATISPWGFTCTEVFASLSWPGMRSRIEPATMSTRSSRAIARAQPIAAPCSVSAPARRSSSEPIAVHFSGSTTSDAPSAAAARVSRSATAMFAT